MAVQMSFRPVTAPAAAAADAAAAAETGYSAGAAAQRSGDHCLGRARELYRGTIFWPGVEI